MLDWKSKRVCILGGAGFIGSHLADKLVRLAKSVVIADNFSSGSHENIPTGVSVYQVDLRDFHTCFSVLEDSDIVFHLASDVGGRAYIMNNFKMWGNLELDATVFRACSHRQIEKLVYLSSACIYPTEAHGYLHESQDKRLERADGVYGMEKLISERMLKDAPFKSLCVRPFTVYGSRMKENRAIGALIARTFIKQDPFEVWGDGNQVVDWVYVEDVVKGILLATEKTNETVNIGSGKVHTPMGALKVIWDYVGWRPDRVVFKTDMPTSPLRLADNTRIRNLGWSADLTFECGLQETVEWYYRTHSVEEVRENLERRLVER